MFELIVCVALIAIAVMSAMEHQAEKAAIIARAEHDMRVVNLIEAMFKAAELRSSELEKRIVAIEDRLPSAND